LNPIEMAFAKHMTLLRQARQRTVEAQWRRIGQLLNQFTPELRSLLSTPRKASRVSSSVAHSLLQALLADWKCP
jgi:hypothetical protein